jgi:hypothetical protein
LGAFSYQGVHRFRERRKPSGDLSVLSSLVAAVDVGHLSGRGAMAERLRIPTSLLSKPTVDVSAWDVA